MSNTAQRTPSEIADSVEAIRANNEYLDPEESEALREAAAALRKPPQQVTPEAIEAACAAYNEFSNGWDEGDNQTHAMREAIEAALSAQRGGSE